MSWEKLFLGADDRLQWETLLTGIVALGGAFWTVRKISEQIRQTEQLAKDHRERRARAACALLPLALSKTSEYAEKCLKRLDILERCFNGSGTFDSSMAPNILTLPIPSLSDDVLSILKESVEFVDNEPAKAIAKLTCCFQIQHSNIASNIYALRTTVSVLTITHRNIANDIVWTAELYSLCGKLFPFSRDIPTKDYLISEKDMEKALRMLSLNFDDPEPYLEIWRGRAAAE
jgi:hypothetical protein